MSVRVMADVWAYSVATGTTLLVQLALADHAEDETRSCFPSIGHLARKCRISESTARRHVHELEDLGEVRKELNAGGSRRVHDSQRPNRYVLRNYPETPPVNLTPVPPVNLTPTVTDDTPPPVTGDTYPLSTVTPESSVNHPDQSSSCDSPPAKSRTTDDDDDDFIRKVVLLIAKDRTEAEQANGKTIRYPVKFAEKTVTNIWRDEFDLIDKIRRSHKQHPERTGRQVVDDVMAPPRLDVVPIGAGRLTCGVLGCPIYSSESDSAECAFGDDPATCSYMLPAVAPFLSPF